MNDKMKALADEIFKDFYEKHIEVLTDIYASARCGKVVMVQVTYDRDADEFKVYKFSDD